MGRSYLKTQAAASYVCVVRLGAEGLWADQKQARHPPQRTKYLQVCEARLDKLVIGFACRANQAQEQKSSLTIKDPETSYT